MPGDDDATKATRGSTSADETAADWLSMAPSTSTPSAVAAPSAPTGGDRYRVVDEIARGGIGRILRAHDTTLDRPIAIKELLQPYGAAATRFERETRITAQLQHPGIIPLHDAGRWNNGEPYFAMKLVNGRSFDEVIHERTTLVDRLGLLPVVIDACHAMAYAHSEGVVHRDLKPQNILVGAFGETVVVDWGLAKVLGEDEISSDGSGVTSTGDSLTRVGAVMGTPAYMPPEQAVGAEVGVQADVYSLGTILYHLLAGAPPFAGTTGDAVLKAVAEGPPPPLDEVVPGVPRDLLAIVTKSMARRIDDRYADAGALVSDLERFQTGQIVGAYQYTTREMVSRWVARNRALVAAAAVVLAVSTGSVLEIVRQRNEAEAARELEAAARLEEAAAKARERRRADAVTVEQARLALDAAPQRSLELLTQVSDDFEDTERIRVIAADALSRPLPRALSGHQADVLSLQWTPDGQHLVTGGLDRVARIWDVAARTSVVLEGHDAGVKHLDISPDGRRLVTAGGQTVRVWALPEGRHLFDLPGHTNVVNKVRFSPDGAWVATGGLDETVRVWDAKTGDLRHALKGHEGLIYDVRWHPSLPLLASAGADVTARLWNVDTGQQRNRWEGPFDLYRVLFTPDGKQLHTLGEGSRALIFDVASGRQVAAHDERSGVWLEASRFSADGQTLYLAGSGGEVVVWSLSGAPMRRMHVGALTTDLVLIPGEKRLITASGNGVTLYDIESGSALRLPGFDHPARRLALSPDGHTIAAAGASDDVLTWSIDGLGGRTLRGEETVWALAIAPDGQLATGVTRARGRLWNPIDGTSRTLEDPDGTRSAAFSPDGRWLATGGWKGTVRLIDREDHREHARFSVRGPVTGLCLSASGEWLAAASKAHEIVVWHVPTGQARLRADTGTEALTLAFSWDDQMLLLGGMEGARSWKLPELGPPETYASHQGIIPALVATRHGVLTGGFDGTVRLWAPGATEGRPLEGFHEGITVMTATPDGFVAAGDAGGTLFFWQLPDPKPQVRRGHSSYVNAIAISHDARMVGSASWDGTARVWSVAEGASASRELVGHTSAVNTIGFMPDDSAVVTGASDLTVRIWDEGLSHEPATLRRQIRSALESL